MKEVTLKVTLTLIGPILTKSTAIGSPGVDVPAAKNEDGQYYLPGTLIKGKLRHSLVELNKIKDEKSNDLLSDLFGEKSETAGPNFEPVRTRLNFTDFVYTGQIDINMPLRYRIHIDSKRGSVAKGALMTIETPFKTGGEYVFSGEITYMTKDKEEADVIYRYLEKGLRWVTSLGAEQTLSFGRLKDVDIRYDDIEIRISTGSAEYAMQDTLVVKLEILKPFCIAKRRTVHNIFESDIVISGAVLRGAIASTLQTLSGLSRNQEIREDTLPTEWQLLGKYFNKIRYSHAFPVRKQNNECPLVPPLSIVKPSGGKESIWYDVALLNNPVLIGKPPLAPEFDIDWKDNSDVRKDFGWDEPRTELRVRTSIDSATRRTREHELFAYEMVLPNEHYWVASIEFGLIPELERRQVNIQLRSLLSYGIPNIGKTKAKAKVDFANDIKPKFSSDTTPIDGKKWIITLQTPALLCDPVLLNETSDMTDLYEAYDAAWNDISSGTLKLTERGYFARQSLAGRYLNMRFQKNKPYNPFLLTDAGSVFVLESTGDLTAAKQCIDRWLHYGLDLPNWAKRPDRYGGDWKTNPFLPIDGFGEIAVNLPCHRQIPPKELQYAIY
jgi:CRISPR/Cas system CSM-associated protein Csm3 (group 7 of RAMP superfamily)